MNLIIFSSDEIRKPWSTWTFQATPTSREKLSISRSVIFFLSQPPVILSPLYLSFLVYLLRPNLYLDSYHAKFLYLSDLCSSLALGLSLQILPYRSEFNVLRKVLSGVCLWGTITGSLFSFFLYLWGTQLARWPRGKCPHITLSPIAKLALMLVLLALFV